MRKYEYLVRQYNGADSVSAEQYELDEANQAHNHEEGESMTLDFYGDLGWELVTIVDGEAIFKRAS